MQILSPEPGSEKHTGCELEYPKQNAHDLPLLRLSDCSISQTPSDDGLSP